MGKKSVRRKLSDKGISLEESEKILNRGQDHTSLSRLSDADLFVVDSASTDAAVSAASAVSWKDRLSGKRFRSHGSVSYDVPSAKDATESSSSSKKPKRPTSRVVLLSKHVTQQKTNASSGEQMAAGRNENREEDLWVGDESMARTEMQSRRKSSLRPAVAVPGGGFSFNPDTNEHQGAVQKAVAIEMKRVRKVKKAENLLQVSRLLKDVSEKNKKQNLAEEEEIAPPVIVPTPRVSHTMRNKLKVKKQNRIALGLRRSFESRMKKIDGVHAIVKDIEEKEKLAEEKRRKNRELEEKRSGFKVLAAARSKNSVPDKTLVEVPLSEELSSSLRTVRGSSLLLKDRLSSFLSRNLVEASRNVKLKIRHKRKVFERGVPDQV
eukprot:ANDGO_02425.mRNA.1 hypothetical protein